MNLEGNGCDLSRVVSVILGECADELRKRALGRSLDHVKNARHVPAFGGIDDSLLLGHQVRPLRLCYQRPVHEQGPIWLEQVPQVVEHA